MSQSGTSATHGIPTVCRTDHAECVVAYRVESCTVDAINHTVPIPPPWHDVLGSDLTVTLVLPLATSDQPPMTCAVAAQLLDTLAAIEDGTPHSSKEHPQSPDIARLEHKVDLVLYLLSAACATTRPAAVEVLLSANGFVLPQTQLPATTTAVALYLCHWLSQPLTLAIDTLRQSADGCGARWQPMDAALHNSLSRWVFRLHRQAIARQRRGLAAVPEGCVGDGQRD